MPSFSFYSLKIMGEFSRKKVRIDKHSNCFLWEQIKSSTCLMVMIMCVCENLVSACSGHFKYTTYQFHTKLGVCVYQTAYSLFTVLTLWWDIRGREPHVTQIRVQMVRTILCWLVFSFLKSWFCGDRIQSSSDVMGWHRCVVGFYWLIFLLVLSGETKPKQDSVVRASELLYEWSSYLLILGLNLSSLKVSL